MKVTLSWLREFAPDIDGDPVELGETLSALGLAVEEMEIIGEVVDGVLLGRSDELLLAAHGEHVPVAPRAAAARAGGAQERGT